MLFEVHEENLATQGMEATLVPINRQVNKKLCYIYTPEYYLAIKKNKILAFTTVWVDLQGIMLSEQVRERQIPFEFTYLCNLKTKIHEQTILKQTQRYKEQTDGCQKEGGWGLG